MQVFRKLSDIQKKEKAVVTIGTFDGIHLGHQQIINQVLSIADNKSCKSVVVTFEPHPRTVIKGNDTIPLLTVLEEKIEIFESFGLDAIFIIPFTKEFSKQTPEEFFKTYIIDGIGLCEVVIGYDHKFGKDRDGDEENLQKLSEKHSFSVSKVHAFTNSLGKVSSTSIRRLIQQDKIAEANTMLGRPYLMKGYVRKGSQRGRILGFPTANIEPLSEYKMIPNIGVYAVEVHYRSETYKGMVNIGNRPTFKQESFAIEVNIFDFEHDIYDEMVSVLFHKKLRDEKKFGSKEELITQLKKDKENTLAFFKRI